MNYYERHLGDYAKDTAHLTMLEHGAYTLLLDRYYATEAPIPADQAHRLARARSPEEREAVDAVLEEFFELRDGQWHHSRCDEVIAEYQDSEPDREAKRENERERKRRYRERRAELFSELAKHGVVPAFNTPMSQLENELSRVLSHGTGHGTDAGRPTGRDGDGTATQTPDTRHQTPEDQKLPPNGGGEVGKPTSPPADLAKRQQERLREVTEDARRAFNATLGKPNGLLPSVRLLTEVRMREVKRCLSVARLICQEQYGSERITPQFWADYFAVAAADDFCAGRVPGGPGHEGWQPDFEYLTRPAVMAKLFDRALADEPQAGVA